VHLSGLIIFFSGRGRLRGAVPPSLELNWTPRVWVFLFIDYFASNYYYVFHSFIPSPRLLSGSWVKVKRHSKDSHYATALCVVV